MIDAHISDGVALTKFLYWIKNINKKKISEFDAQNKLEFFRKKKKNIYIQVLILLQALEKMELLFIIELTKNQLKKLIKKTFFYVILEVNINMEQLMLQEQSVFLNQNKISRIFSLKF